MALIEGQGHYSWFVRLAINQISPNQQDRKWYSGGTSCWGQMIGNKFYGFSFLDSNKNIV